jgi:enamine deaminase RidA (YjgF/YER057c/UK114 family)
MIKRIAPYGGILHEVVAHNGTLYFAGIVADQLDGGIEAQTQDCMRQLETLLKANGSDLAHVLQVTIYLSDVALRDGFNAVWKRTFKPEQMPARASIGVANLGKDVLVELVVIAAVKT